MASERISGTAVFRPSGKLYAMLSAASAAVVLALIAVNVLFIFLMAFPLAVIGIGIVARKSVSYTVDLDGKRFVVKVSPSKEVSVPLDRIVEVEMIAPSPLRFLDIGAVKVITEGGSAVSTYYVDNPRRLCGLLRGEG